MQKGAKDAAWISEKMRLCSQGRMMLRLAGMGLRIYLANALGGEG